MNTQWSSPDLVQTWHGSLNEPLGLKHPCYECLQGFSTRLSLSTHIKSHHKLFCRHCWKIVDSEEELDDHIQQCHTTGLDTSIDSLTFLGGCLSDDSTFQTPPKPSAEEPATRGLASDCLEMKRPKRPYRRRKLERQVQPSSPPESDLVKTTRSGRIISSKVRD